MRISSRVIYIADDGREFYDEARCKKWESDLKEVKEFESKFHKPPAKYNGESYVQHPYGTRKKFENKVIEWGCSRDDDTPKMKIVSRMWAIDEREREREWGQPFFGLNPDQQSKDAYCENKVI